MNVLSLFDGMSCGRIALDRAGIPVTEYYASEIDKYAIKVSEANYPDIIRLGDVRTVNGEDLPQIDLLLAGSPCQGFSFAGKQLAFDDPRSALFFEFVRILKETKPKYFLLENVKMKKEYQDIISEAVGVEPVEINSALVSAQNRKRLYWTNIPNVTQPEDRSLLLKDVLECGANFLHQRGRGNNTGGLREGKSPSMGSSSWEQNVSVAQGISGAKKLFNVNPSGRGQNGNVYSIEHKAPCVTTNKGKGSKIYIDNERFNSNKRMKRQFKELDEKSKTLLASMWKGSQSNGMTNVNDGIGYRKLTPTECERLQTLPDNFTEVNKEIEKCYANKKVAIESQALENLVTTACSTIKELKDTETRQLQRIIGNIKKLDVNIVKGDQLLEVCATSTIKTGEGTQTLNIQKRLEENLALEAIEKQETAKLFIELLSRNELEENLNLAKLYIISIVTSSIILLETYIFAKDNRSTRFSIDNLKLSQDSSLKWDISNLKTANIKSIVSNTQRYKMLGNGWTVDVIAHILRGMI